MKNKILILSIIFITLITPITVEANVICKDGTVSPTCSVCSRGCCSHHGGCSNNYDYSDNYNNSNNSANNGVISSDDYFDGEEFETEKQKESIKDYENKMAYIEISVLATIILGITCLVKLLSKGGI